jgi:hypothetical protein
MTKSDLQTQNVQKRSKDAECIRRQNESGEKYIDWISSVCTENKRVVE